MASEHSDYIRGEMPVFGHDITFKGFVKTSAFSTALLIVVLLMPILVFTVHLSWLPALIITFVVGMLISPAFKLGGAWYATLFGLTAVTGLVCILISMIAG